jgi:hypothetical protein
MMGGDWEGVSIYTPATAIVEGEDTAEVVIGSGATIEPGPTRLWVTHTGQNDTPGGDPAKLTIVSPSLDGGTQTFTIARGGGSANAYTFYIELRQGITSMSVVEMATARTLTFITARG